LLTILVHFPAVLLTRWSGKEGDGVIARMAA
jgi:hypothetical protein